MRAYLTPVGLAHSALGLLTAAVGVLPVGLAVLIGVQAMTRAVGSLAYLLLAPESWFYLVEGLVFDALLVAMFALPGVLLVGVGAFEVFAGIGLLMRWRSARWASLVAAAPNVLLGLPGIALAVGTVAVVLDPDVQLELGSGR
jgi:hypothetical protein